MSSKFSLHKAFLALAVYTVNQLVDCQEGGLHLIEDFISNGVNDLVNVGSASAKGLGSVMNLNPATSLLKFNFFEMGSDVLDGAIRDLEKMQSQVLGSSSLLPSETGDDNGYYGFQILQTFGPITIPDLARCQFPMMNTTMNGDNGMSPSSAYGNAQGGTGGSLHSATPADNMEQNGATSISGMGNDNPMTSPTCNDLWSSIMSGSIVSNYLDQALARTSATLDVIEGAIKKYIGNTENISNNQFSSYRNFVNGILNALGNRLQSKESLWGDATDLLERFSNETTSFRQDLSSTGFDYSRDFITNTWDKVQSSLEFARDWQPVLYTWIEAPAALASGAGSVLRGATRPLTANIGSALVPMGLGKEIQNLAKIDPNLMNLFPYFNNPSSAPVFVTMKTLLDEMTQTGTVSGFEDRFHSLMEPYASMVQPTGMKVGLANACLSYLRAMDQPTT